MKILFKVEFANVYVTNIQHYYNHKDNHPARFRCTLTPGITRYFGDNSIIHELGWNPDNPFLHENTPVTTIEKVTPQITSLKWINSDTLEEDIAEIGYKEKAGLVAVIKNPEESTATITIEKEDGSEFETGQKTLTFTEAIENGIVELTPMEIKAQWEEFKTSDIDKLVAKVSHGETTKQSKPLRITPPSKVVVDFRTGNSYKGEYGFDWLRMGDTGKPGDVWYKDIIGSYATGRFVQSDAEYTKLSKCFEMPQHPIKPKDKYVVPVLALLPNAKATLTLKIQVEGSDAKKIEYKYDKNYFNLSATEVPHTTVGKKELADGLTIECIKEFGEDRYIEIEADGNFAGKLKVLANDKAHRYKADVVFVRVETDLLGKGKSRIPNILNKRKEFTKYLNQALATASYKIVDLDLSTDATFNDTYAPEGTLVNANTDAFQDYLNTALKNQHKTDYSKYYKVYFIDEAQGGLYGRAYDIPAPAASRSVIVLRPGLTDSTLAHETYHAMGLYHTFDNNSNFTFEQYKTDNIMDYSDIGTDKIPVIGTYQWQWDILHKNIDKE